MKRTTNSVISFSPLSKKHKLLYLWGCGLLVFTLRFRFAAKSTEDQQVLVGEKSNSYRAKVFLITPLVWGCVIAGEKTYSILHSTQCQYCQFFLSTNLVIRYSNMYTGRQPSYKDKWNRTAVKSCPTSFRSILTHYYLYKCIVWSHIFISSLSSMFSSTLWIACTISVVLVRWLSSSILYLI